MKPKHFWFVLFAFLLGVPAIPAELIYTWTDESGVQRFSDQPPEDKADFDTIPAAPPSRENGTRQEYLRMMEQVEQERHRREREARREAEARAQEEKQRAEAERRARIDAERRRLQDQIDELNNRAMSPYFTQGMRDAQIEEIQEKIDALE